MSGSPIPTLSTPLPHLSCSRLSGSAITPRHWDRFYKWYLATVNKKWGTAYLTRDFFQMLGETMGERVLLVVAEEGQGEGGGGGNWAGQGMGAAGGGRGVAEDAMHMWCLKGKRRGFCPHLVTAQLHFT